MASTTRSDTSAVFAASETATATCSSAGVAGASSGVALLGRTRKIGVPFVTCDLTMVEPPNTCWVTTGPDAMSTTSQINPDPVFAAVRAATSRPSAVAAISNAAGDAEPRRPASTSACGATTYLSMSSDSAT